VLDGPRGCTLIDDSQPMRVENEDVSPNWDERSLGP
jgi:hypothetical protein